MYNVIIDYDEELMQNGSIFKFDSFEKLSDFLKICLESFENGRELIIQKEE